MSPDPFSKRHNYRGPVPEITVREDAPEALRVTTLETARQLGWSPLELRDVICRVLRVRPDASNWSEYPNVWHEVQGLVYGAPWFRVYDMIEAIFAGMPAASSGISQRFAEEINACLIEEGIGWQLADGLIVTRGAEAFEAAVAKATVALSESNRPTSAGHIHEALQALSRRPDPDLSGAIYHAMGALEALARDLVGDERATLGEVLKRYPDLLPAPLDKALSQIWGFASNEARHVVEGREPTRADAELVVGLASTIATYLAKRGRS